MFKLMKTLRGQITTTGQKGGEVEMQQWYVFASGVVRSPGFEPGIAGLEGLHQDVCVLPG
jgi:hypothetical protein